MNVVWEINLTTISVLVAWIGTMIGAALYIMRQGDIVKTLSDVSKTLHSEQTLLEAKISLVNESMIGDYIKRAELNSYRSEQQNFLNNFEEKMVRSVDRLGDRLDRVLHDIAKGALDAHH